MWFSFWPSLFIYINVSSEIVDKMTKGSSILCIEQIWTNSTESHPLSSRVFFYRIIYHTFFQKEKKEPRDVLLRMEGREGERDGAVLREPSGDVRGEVEKAKTCLVVRWDAHTKLFLFHVSPLVNKQGVSVVKKK